MCMLWVELHLLQAAFPWAAWTLSWGRQGTDGLYSWYFECPTPSFYTHITSLVWSPSEFVATQQGSGTYYNLANLHHSLFPPKLEYLSKGKILQWERSQSKNPSCLPSSANNKYLKWVLRILLRPPTFMSCRNNGIEAETEHFMTFFCVVIRDRGYTGS